MVLEEPGGQEVLPDVLLARLAQGLAHRRVIQHLVYVEGEVLRGVSDPPGTPVVQLHGNATRGTADECFAFP